MLPSVELEVRHLRALCAIADTGSVRKAAVRLGMTQPSLTTQLRRIETAIGGPLFTRGRAGSQPTPLGQTVLSRARPIVAEMTALVAAARDAAAAGLGGLRLRIGGIGSRAVAGWLLRIHKRLPEVDTTVHIDVSSTTLVQLLCAGRLDLALLHEPAGFPLHLPDGLQRLVVVPLEPRFIALSAAHPAAEQSSVPLAQLAEDAWIVDPAADHDCAALRHAFTLAGLSPRLLNIRDHFIAGDLVAAAEAVRPCQPLDEPAAGTVVRPLRDDPLTGRLLLAARPGALSRTELDELCGDLREAYGELVAANATYQGWLERHGSTLFDEVWPWPTGTGHTCRTTVPKSPICGGSSPRISAP
ncbi:LysR family transcriptional regulator [Streptomyces sp. NPDC052396]|uniref:LysR family transcriptional regulator n=1 Tax=Streptomyces sp. NPDC052396 TaxID=3365689 RepID=UPI0037D6E376